MNILEKEIEDIIWEASGETLIKRGLYVKKGSLKFRQLNLASYGIADIVSVKLHKQTQASQEHNYKHSEWVVKVDVIELKKDEINLDTLMQAIGYCKGIDRFLSQHLSTTIQYTIDFGIILIGKRIEEKSDFCFMPDFFNNLSLYTYHIDIEKGITFKSHSGYKQNSEVERVPDLSEYINTSNIKRLLASKSSETNHWLSV